MDRWREVLAGMSAEERDALLFSLVEQNADLQERLVVEHTRLVPDDAEDAEETWRDDVEDILYQYDLDEKGAYTAMSEALLRYFGSRAEKRFREGMLEETFRFACAVYLAAVETAHGVENGEINAYDFEVYWEYDGGTTLSDTIDECVRYWKMVLERADPALQQRMMDWFSERTEEKEYGEIRSFLYGEEWDVSLLPDLLEHLTGMLDDMEPGRQDRWMEDRIRIQERMGKTQEEIREDLQSYCECQTVLDWLREYSLARGDRDGAIRFLKLAREKYPRDGERYTRKLLEQYEILNDREHCLEERKRLVLEEPSGKFEDVIALRELAPSAQWPAMASQIEAIPLWERFQYRLLALDEKWSQMFERIRSRGDLSGLFQWCDALRKWDEIRVRDLLAHLLDQGMAGANTDTYAVMAKGLLTLSDFPEGESLGRALAAKWRKDYSRRRNMKKALDEVGF